MEEHPTTLRQNLQLLADLWFYSIKIYLLFYKIWILRGKVFKSQLVLIIMCFLGRIDKCLALKKRHKMWAELKKTSFCLLRVSFFLFFPWLVLFTATCGQMLELQVVWSASVFWCVPPYVTRTVTILTLFTANKILPGALGSSVIFSITHSSDWQQISLEVIRLCLNLHFHAKKQTLRSCCWTASSDTTLHHLQWELRRSNEATAGGCFQSCVVQDGH